MLNAVQLRIFLRPLMSCTVTWPSNVEINLVPQGRYINFVHILQRATWIQARAVAKEKLPDFPKSLYAGSLKPPVMDLALNQSCDRQTD